MAIRHRPSCSVQACSVMAIQAQTNEMALGPMPTPAIPPNMISEHVAFNITIQHSNTPTRPKEKPGRAGNRIGSFFWSGGGSAHRLPSLPPWRRHNVGQNCFSAITVNIQTVGNVPKHKLNMCPSADVNKGGNDPKPICTYIWHILIDD